MPSTMKALHLLEPHRFTLETVPVPDVADGQALVRFHTGHLCGSDAIRYRGGRKDIYPPLPVGMPIHECTGEIVSSRIPGLTPGTEVLAMPEDTCGLSDFFVARREKIAPLWGWPGSDLICAGIAQPLATVLAGIERLGAVQGQTALVFGLGTMGMLACLLLKRRGVAPVLAVDPNPFRRHLAAELLGVRAVAELPENWRWVPQIVVEAVGQDHHRETLPRALDVVQPYGKILLYGLPVEADAVLPAKPIIRKNLTVFGSIKPNWETYLPDGVRMALENVELLRRFVTHRFPWKNAQNAFELFLAPDSPRLKIVLVTE